MIIMNNISRLNNFNFFRLLFASMVIFSHSFALLGKEEPSIWGRSLGNLAVHGFFIISGYLICKSYVTNPGITRFFTNRILRIAPGLIVSLVICHYLSAFFDGFKTNYLPYIVNGPIWTLTWEVVCYTGVVALGLLFTLNKNSFPALFCGVLIAYILNSNNSTDAYVVIAPIVLMFMSGMFIFIMEPSINLLRSAVVAALCLFVLANVPLSNSIIDWVHSNILFLWGPAISNEAVIRILYIISLPFLVLFLGKGTKPIISLKEDISYGVYIYGWPAAQVLVYMSMQYQLDIKPVQLFIATMVITTPIAYVSWIIIEKPSLSLKRLFFKLNPAVQS